MEGERGNRGTGKAGNIRIVLEKQCPEIGLKAVFPAGIPGYSHRRNLVFIWSRNSGTVLDLRGFCRRYTGSYPYPEPFYS